VDKKFQFGKIGFSASKSAIWMHYETTPAIHRPLRPPPKRLMAVSGLK